MASITQTVENFLGGVSKQPDDKKLPGQVRDSINAYIDPTFGLTKRPGTKFIKELGTGDDDPVSSTEFSDSTIDYYGRWFYINRDDDEQYLGCVKLDGIRIWNVKTGDEATVTTESYLGLGTYDPNSYLSLSSGNPRDNIQVLTVQDTTFIVNKTKTVGVLNESTTDPSTPLESEQFPSPDFGPEYRNFGYVEGQQGTIRVTSVEFGATYEVTITYNGTPYTASITTRNGESTNPGPNDFEPILNVEEILGWIVNGNPANPSGSGGAHGNYPAQAGLSTLLSGLGFTFTILEDSIEVQLAPSSTPNSFSITAKGGISGDSIEAFTNTVNNISDLPTQSVQNRRVTIQNTASAEDTYYVRFIAENGTSGDGYWEEFVKPNISIHLNPRTMPHELVNTGVNAFTFRAIEAVPGSPEKNSWEQRLVGDNESNSLPSFVNFPIREVFFYNNRLGFLSNDNVILSKTNDFFNFFFTTALTQTANDPVDLSCSALRPATLNFVLPVPQGLVLFSDNQQFILFSDTGVITPATAAIRSLSNYECDTLIDPVDVGTNLVFMSKTPGYSRTYALKTRGFEENPDVLDVGKVVSEYVPDTIDNLQASPQNSFVLMSSSSDEFVYFYRTYADAEQTYMQAWFRWKMAGNVQYCLVDSDDFFAVTKQEGKYTIIKANLTQAPEDRILTTADGQVVQTCVDMYALPSNVIYNDVTDKTEITLPYTDVSGRETIVLVADLPAGGSTESGYIINAVRSAVPNVWEVAGQNLVSLFTANRIYVGFRYDMEVELPRFYYRKSENAVDYTASLTVARIKFSVKQSSSIEFKLQTQGRPDWHEVQSVQLADFYLASDVPLKELVVYTVPIHQRNDNFNLKIFSNSPFPLSVTSMSWEGRYSPRYYSRQ